MIYYNEKSDSAVIAYFAKATCIVLFFLIAFSNTSYSASRIDSFTGFYEGKIANKYPISASIRVKDNKLVGFYYYLKHGQDIPLKGVIKEDGQFEVNEYGNVKTGVWLGAIDNSGTITGSWNSSKKSLKLSLKRIERYNKSILKVLPGDAEHKEIIINDIGFKQYPVGKTGIRFLKLSKHHNEKVLKKINKNLKRIIDDSPVECTGNNGYLNLSYDVTSLNKSILSIRISENYYCKGSAYPTNGAGLSITFDLNTGKRIRFKKLFTDFYKKQRSILQVIFDKPLKEASKWRKLKGGNTEGCKGFLNLDALTNYGFDYYITEKQLVVKPNWPHAIAACAMPVSISLNDKKIMPFLNQKNVIVSSLSK